MILRFNKKQLFEAITSRRNWYKATDERDAFCDTTFAAVMKIRHAKGQLSEDQYDKLAFHFGFIKEPVTYVKN